MPSSTTRLGSSAPASWAIVLISGLVLAVVALFDRGGLGDSAVTADGSTSCRLEVTTEQLNVRASPSQSAEQVDTLYRGDQVDGTPIVSNGYRELEGSRWGLTEFLTPVAGSDCS